MLISPIACIVVPVLLVCWSSAGRIGRSIWPAAAVAAVYGLALVHGAASNVHVPREWDYACFWLYGHVAAAHLNVYDPAALTRFPLPFRIDDDFRSAVLDVGFPYPPPTIALFLPLGFIDNVRVGLALWYAVQFAAFAGAAWVLARVFWPADGWRGALLVLALLAALPASMMNVGDAQTNFLALLVIALALRGQATPAGAIWTALAIWVKPYAAALLLVDVVRRRSRRLLVAAATVAASFAAALAVLGPATLASYVRANPAGREPAAAFIEVVNQSLLAVVLRLQLALPPHVSPLHEPLYVAGAVVLAAATVVCCARRSAPPEVAFAATLLLGLLLYPGSLSSYGVVLVVPMLVLWRRRSAFAGGTPGAAATIAVAVLLQSGALQRGFEANLLMWAACTYLLIVRRVVRDEGVAPPMPIRYPVTAGAAR